MKIKIDFVDFWGGLIKDNNFFYNLLREDYEVEISSTPDIIFYSVFGGSNKRYTCRKVFYTGENIGANFNDCDYAITFDWLEDKRNYRLPLYVLYEDSYNKILDPKPTGEKVVSRKFCNAVISNPGASPRNNFITTLSDYKQVDMGGRYGNNVGGAVVDKNKFQSNYKFSVCYENDAYRGEYPGYTTEKIVEAMAANSIPVYWGNPEVHKEFNTKSFINYYDFPSEKQMIEYIKYLDNNDLAYLEKFSEFWHTNNELPENNKKENIKKFLNKIVNGT
jgi:hypothetical protein